MFGILEIMFCCSDVNIPSTVNSDPNHIQLNKIEIAFLQLQRLLMRFCSSMCSKNQPQNKEKMANLF